MANPIAPLIDPLAPNIEPIGATPLPPSGIQAAWIPSDFVNNQPLYIPIDASDGVAYTRTLGIDPNLNTFFVVGRINDYPHIDNPDFNPQLPPGPSNPPTIPILSPENVGTLTLADGDGRTVVFNNETIHEVSETLNIRGGEVVRIVIKDKRYVLNRGALFGSWNQTKPGQEFDSEGQPVALTPTQRLIKRQTLRELAVVCFEEMGLEYDVDPLDRAFDVEMLKYRDGDPLKELDPDLDNPDPNNPDNYIPIKKPNPEYDPDNPILPEFIPVQVGDDIQVYPSVNWEGDSPGRELQRILDDHGFAISLWGDHTDILTPVQGEPVRRMAGKLVVVKLGKRHPYQANGYVAPSGRAFDHTEERYTSTNQAKDVVVLGGRIVIQTELVNQTRRLSGGGTEILKHYNLEIGLEPVGLDLDGEIRPIGELSYAANVEIGEPQPHLNRPFGNFVKVGLDDTAEAFTDIHDDPENGVVYVPPDDPDEPNVPEPGTGEYKLKLARIQKLAAASVWKWYQLPKSEHWRLPLLPEIVQAKIIGQTRRRATPIVKIKTLQDFGFIGGNETAFREVTQGYTLDLDRGIVKFDKSQMRRASTEGLTNPAWEDGDVVHAHVSLTFAFNSVSVIKDEDDIHDSTKWIPQTHLRDFYHFPKAYQDSGEPVAPANITESEIIRRPEMILYRIAPFNVAGAVDDTNRKELDQFSRRVIREHRINETRILYAPEGNIPLIVDKLSTDGMFRQIAWSVSGGQGAETSLSVNRERPRGNTGALEYQMRGLLNRLLLKHNRFDAQNLGIDQPLPIGTAEKESPRKARSRPGTIAIKNKNEESSPLLRTGEVDESTIPPFSFVELGEPEEGGTLGVLPIRKPDPATVNPRYLVTDASVVRESTAFAAREGLVYVRLDSNDPMLPAIGDYVSPGLGTGQDPYKAYRGSHFRVFDVLPADEAEGRPDPLALIEMPTIFDTAFRAVVLEVQDEEGHHWLRCRKIIQQPDVYDPDAPDILADAGFWSWFQCGDRVVLLRVATIPGDPAEQASYYAFFNPPIDQVTKIEPHADCSVRAINACPPPSPDPNPCSQPATVV